MKTILLALAFTISTTDAYAISRYNTLNMTCNEVQAVLQKEGAAILSYRSRRTGAPLYGRYVYTRFSCDVSEYADWRYVPTADNPNCVVKQCEAAPFIRPDR